MDIPTAARYAPLAVRSADDIQVVHLAERLGLPLGWVTDDDLAVDPTVLRGSTGLVVGGYAEYWTAPTRPVPR